MKRILSIRAARSSLLSKDAIALAQEAVRIEIAKSALTAATVVFSAGLVVIASGADNRIARFLGATPKIASAASHQLDRALAWTIPSLGAGAPDQAAMLIARDPGSDAWARMLAGGTADASAASSLVAGTTLKLAGPGPIPMIVPLRAWTLAATDPAAVASSWPEIAATGPSAGSSSLGNRAAFAATTDSSGQSPTPGQQAGFGRTGGATSDNVVSPGNPARPGSDLLGPPRPPLGGPFAPPQPTLGETAAVPEPAAWLCYILGFGAVGTAFRRDRQRKTCQLRSSR